MELPSLPTERAPAILIFGPLADRVAGLLRSRPSLTARITFAPREAIHAIAAFLYLAPEAADTDTEVANLVDACGFRGLLAKAIPDCPARLYRALDTAGNEVQPLSFYQRLGTASRGPLGTELLNGKLSDERLDFYEAIQTMNPLVANLRTAMPETQHVAEAVNTLISMIRSHDALGECDVTLPKNARTNAVLRRLMRGVDAIRAPALPFTPPPSLRFVGSIGDLRQIGRKFENCLTRMDHYANGRESRRARVGGEVAKPGRRPSSDLCVAATVRRLSDNPNQYRPNQPRDERTDCNPSGRRQVVLLAFLGHGGTPQERDKGTAYPCYTARPAAIGLRRMGVFDRNGGFLLINHATASSVRACAQSSSAHLDRR